MSRHIKILISAAWLSALLTVITVADLWSQEEQVKPLGGAVVDPGFGLGANFPAGDLSARYGGNLNFSVSPSFITAKNWILQGDFIYLFGNYVKEDVLAPLRNSSGLIPGDDGQVADVFLRERGLYIGLGGGRLFPLRSGSKSGIKAVISGGILQHGIRFVDERNSIPQLRAGRSKGYDRLTRGFALKETLGYKLMTRNGRMNFELNFDFIQGFTSEVRAFNFDTGLPTNKSRLDLLFGIRLVWNLPFYLGSEEVVYY